MQSYMLEDWCEPEEYWPLGVWAKPRAFKIIVFAVSVVFVIAGISGAAYTSLMFQSTIDPAFQMGSFCLFLQSESTAISYNSAAKSFKRSVAINPKSESTLRVPRTHPLQYLRPSSSLRSNTHPAGHRCVLEQREDAAIAASRAAIAAIAAAIAASCWPLMCAEQNAAFSLSITRDSQPLSLMSCSLQALPARAERAGTAAAAAAAGGEGAAGGGARGMMLSGVQRALTIS
jgi:hypothetical protein